MELPKLLFVDDDPQVLSGLENLLFDYDTEWDMAFVTDPQEAIEQLRTNKIDVLISDMRMPVIDGHELMRQAQAVAPASYRIMLSGTTEWELAEETLTVAHDFLSKPCSEEMLVDVLGRGVKLASAGMNDMRQRLGSIATLPPRPKLYGELSVLIAKDAPLKQITELLERDVGLSAKLLHLANTAFFSGGRRIETVGGAIQRLGLACVRGLVLSAEAFRERSPQVRREVEDLNAHCADVAMRAAKIAPPKLRAAALVAGLMHDIGTLVLVCDFNDEFHRTRAPAGSSFRDQLEAEEAVFGWNHADIGAHLLRLWNVDAGTCLAVGYHHDPGVAPKTYEELAWTVHLATISDGEEHQPAPPSVQALVERWEALNKAEDS